MKIFYPLLLCALTLSAVEPLEYFPGQCRNVLFADIGKLLTSDVELMRQAGKSFSNDPELRKIKAYGLLPVDFGRLYIAGDKTIFNGAGDFALMGRLEMTKAVDFEKLSHLIEKDFKVKFLRQKLGAYPAWGIVEPQGRTVWLLQENDRTFIFGFKKTIDASLKLLKEKPPVRRKKSLLGDAELGDLINSGKTGRQLWIALNETGPFTELRSLMFSAEFKEALKFRLIVNSLDEPAAKKHWGFWMMAKGWILQQLGRHGLRGGDFEDLHFADSFEASLKLRRKVLLNMGEMVNKNAGAAEADSGTDNEKSDQN